MDVNELKPFAIIAFLFILIGSFVGFPIGRWSKKCPNYNSGISIKDSTVFSDDTLKLTTPEIKIVTKHKIIYLSKIVHDTVEKILTFLDSTECIETPYQMMPDSAKIGLSLCSKKFDLVLPDDAKLDINYIPPPKHIIEKTEYDTLTITKSHKTGLGLYFGWGTDLSKTIENKRFYPTFSAGVCIYLKIKGF